MIPFSVSDLIKLLDEIPLWKAVVGLPKRLGELERKVVDLESRLDDKEKVPPTPQARVCPICDSSMKVTSERPHRTFGIMGLKTHSMSCPNCNHTTERDFDPGKGYR
jgi:endogenous inhibitor of DNA gyrase (YacG/DUF329 family)